jgi:hypothetical protein
MCVAVIVKLLYRYITHCQDPHTRPKNRSSSPDRGKIFLLSTSSRPDMGSTQPPIQWVQCAISPEVKRPGSEAERSQLVPR